MFRTMLSLFFVSTAFLFSAPAPTIAADQPGSQLIGQTFSQQLCLSNGSSTTGYNPQFEVVVPAGLALSSADFYGTNALKQTETCSAHECNVTNTSTGVVTTIDENQTFYVLEYPIGSFPQSLPEQCMDAKFDLESTSSGNVQLGTDLNVSVKPLFALGETAVDDGNYTYGAPQTLIVSPNVLILKKSNNAREGEKATGPSYPIVATLKLNIADGETVDDVNLTDTLDPGMHFISLDSDGGCTNHIQIPSTAIPGGTLVLGCGAITGTTVTERTIQYQYYIDQNDSAGNEVLEDNGTKHKILTNQVESNATYKGSLLPAARAESSVTGMSITMYKSSTISNEAPPTGFSPGDEIVYTLTLQTSDYYKHQDIIISDLLKDGQTAKTPIESEYTIDGTTHAFVASNVHQCTDAERNASTDGSCLLEFNLSKQLADDGLNATVEGNKTIQIKFETTVDKNYRILNGGKTLAMGDTVQNSVEVEASIPGAGRAATDNSSETNTIRPETFEKTIYAVDGNTSATAPYNIHAGNTVTYRLKSIMPVKSFYDYKLTDFLPNPFFDADEVNESNGSGPTPPPAGKYKFGPDHQYDAPPIFHKNNGASDNKLLWTFGDNNNSERNATIDILFTVTATHKPMADNLYLANIATTDYKGAGGEPHSSNGIIDIRTEEPQIVIEKKIIGSSNPLGQKISPPHGYADAMEKVDANDTITYQIHLLNKGHAIAYDVDLTDRWLQDGVGGQGMVCAIGSIVVDTNSSNSTAIGDLFAGTYHIDQLDPVTYYDINYTCEVDQAANPGGDIDNNATLKSYSSAVGGPTFVNKVITSKAKLKLTGKMEIVKRIKSTSIPATTGSRLNQGEIVTFEINVTLGEGTYTQYQVTDNTCALSAPVISSNVRISGTTVTVEGSTGSVDGNLSYTCDMQMTANGTNTATVRADKMTSKSGHASWEVIPPQVSTNKVMTPKTGSGHAYGDAGDEITVALTWDNDSNDTDHPAYRCRIVDELNASVFDVSTFVMSQEDANYSCSISGNRVQCDYNGTLSEPCSDATVKFKVKIRDDVNASTRVKNKMVFHGQTLPHGHTNENSTTYDGNVTSSHAYPLYVRSPLRPIKHFTKSSETFTDPGDGNLSNTPSVAIGETMDVNITYRFREGVTREVTLIDESRDPQTFVYVPNSMQISRSDANTTVGNADINASLSGVPVGTFVDVNDTNISFSHSDKRINLFVGDVFNHNTHDGGGYHADLILHFKVKVQNTSTTSPGTILSNRGGTRYRNYRDRFSRPVSTWVYAKVATPKPEITKENNATGVVGAGDVVHYSIQICNDASNATTHVTSAFEWNVTDPIPDELTLDGASVVADANGTGANIVVDNNGTEINATIDRLDKGECVSIGYNATVKDTAQFGSVVQNTAVFMTTSLPGTYGTAGNQGLLNNTSGQVNGERNGNGTAPNNLYNENTSSVTVRDANLTKTLLSKTTPYAIGEVVEYRVVTGIPKGETKQFKIIDTLPMGLSFDNAKLSVTLGAGITAEHNVSVVKSNASADASNVVVFDFGDLNATTASSIRLDYNVTIRNILSNQNGSILANEVNATHDDPNNQGNAISVAHAFADRNVTIAEPNLEMTKETNATHPQAGDTVSWKVTIKNSGTMTAYAVDWNDTLPAHLAEISNATLAQSGDINKTGTTTALATSDLSENNTTLTLASFDIPAGAELNITFDAKVQDSAVSGETQTNHTYVTNYKSILGADGSLLGGRDGSNCAAGDNDNGSNPLNNYCESVSKALEIDPDITIEKHLLGANQYTIGQTVSYEMNVTVIEGVTQNVVVQDTLPEGMHFVTDSNSTSAPHATYAAPTISASGRDINITFVEVNNTADVDNTNDYITIRFDALLENVAANQADRNRTNTVKVTSGGNATGMTDTSEPFTILEPDLNITKTLDTLSHAHGQAAGDEVTYTLTVGNHGTSEAYDINLTDTLPAELLFVRGDAEVNGTIHPLRIDEFNLTVGSSKTFHYTVKVKEGTAVNKYFNQATVLYGGLPNANGSANGGRNGKDGSVGLNNYSHTTNVDLDVNHNELNISKKVTWTDQNNDGLINHGDWLDYNISIDNNWSIAVGDVNVTDEVPSETTYRADTLALSDMTGATTDDANTSCMKADIDTLASGEVRYMTFGVEINATIPPGITIRNVAKADSNRTIPTTSNEANVTTDQRGIAAVPDKNITGSDQNFTAEGYVTVGEIIDVNLTFGFSGGTTKQVTMRDNFDTTQFAYVAGSMYLDRNNTTIHVAQPDLNASWEPGNLLTIAVDDSNLTLNSTGLELNISDVFNSDYNLADLNATTGTLGLRFQLRVLNGATVQAGAVLEDNASVHYSEYNTSVMPDVNTTKHSPSVGVTVVEPDLNVTKQVDLASQSLGDVITYTIRAENNGTTDAFDINFTDTLDAGLSYIPSTAAGATIVQSGQMLTFNLADLNRSHVKIITYQAQIGTNVAVPKDLSNSLNTKFHSLPDANGSTNGGRNGDGGINRYHTNTQATVTTNTHELNISKSVRLIDDVNHDNYINAGDVLEYNITIDNNWSFAVGEVNVTDTLPSEVTYRNGTLTLSDSQAGDSTNDGTAPLIQGWIASLSAGEVRHLTCQVTINADVPTGTTIVNTAKADSNRTIPVISNEANVTTQVADFNVTKEVNATTADHAGQTLRYTVVLENNGTVDLTNIDINDTLSNASTPPVGTPSGDNVPTGILNVGEKWIYVFNYTVTQADLDSGAVLTNIVKVETNETIPTKEANATTTVTQHPDLNITKVETSGVAAASVGQILNYNIIVDNNGTIRLSDINVTDTMPDGSVGTLSGPSGNANGDAFLDTDETWIYTAHYAVTQTDLDNNVTLVNHAKVSTHETHDHNTSASTPVVQHPDLNITKVETTGAAAVTAGQVLDYNITLDNNGTIRLSDVNVTDTMPNGLTTTLVLVQGDEDNNSMLDANETWTYAAHYTVTQADLDTNITLVNHAKVHTHETPDHNASASTVIAQNIHYTVVKHTRSVPSQAGDILIYIFDVNNTGNVTLKDINFTDPKCMTFPIYQGGDVDGNESILSIGEMQEYNCTSIPVTQAEMDAGSVYNEVNVTLTPPSGIITPPVEANVTTPVTQSPDLNITKIETTGADALYAGQQLDYTITVDNNGTITLTDINITDRLSNGVAVVLSGPIGDDNSDDKIDVNETWVYAASYILSQADIDKGGTLTNTATINTKQTPTKEANASTTIVRTATIHITKDTNSTPIYAGDTLLYVFDVNNTGTVTLTDVNISDLKCDTPPVYVRNIDTINDGNSTILSVGEVQEYNCTSIPVTQTEVDVGNVDNEANVTAVPPGSMTPPLGEGNVTRPVPKTPAIQIEKSTNGQDADTSASALIASLGDRITWEYNVTNTGNMVLKNIKVTDDKEGAICNKNTLQPTESTVCHAYGVANQIGLYMNIATVTAEVNASTEVNATDRSHYRVLNVPSAAIGDYVWYDDNVNGLQDSNEHGVSGMRVYLLNGSGNRITDSSGSDIYRDTNGSGWYTFDSLLPQHSYAVEFDLSTLPKDTTGQPKYEVTHQNSGTDTAVDSDPDVSSGQTVATPLAIGQKYLDFDMGIKLIVAHIGDYFWIDENKNGIQDPGELPVAGARVELLDKDGNPVVDENGNQDVVTDANGTYGFDVMPGEYQLRFFIPDTGYDGYVFTQEYRGGQPVDSEVDSNGYTRKVTVKDGENILYFDAGIECGCSNIPSDNAETMNLFLGILMILLTLTIGVGMFRKEGRKRQF